MPSFLTETSTPVDGGANSNKLAVVDTSLLAMQAGDLVYVSAVNRHASSTFSVIDTGGQTWLAESNLTGQGLSSRGFMCVFNGTWASNPSFAPSGGTNNVPVTAVMAVFRPDGGTSSTWAVDVAGDAATFAAPLTPFDVTRTGITTLHDKVVTIASFVAGDDITWERQTTGWPNPGGIAQVRNTAGSDTSVSLVYKIQAVAGATGDVTNRQSAGWAGHTRIASFYEIPGTSPTPTPTDDGVIGGHEIGAFAIGSDSTLEAVAEVFPAGEIGAFEIGALEVGGPSTGPEVSAPTFEVTTSPKFKIGTLATPATRTLHRFVYSYSKNQSGGEQIDLTARIYEDSTLRVEREHININETVQSIDSLLADLEAQSFVNYGALYVEFEFTKHKDASNRIGRVYWARFDIPDASALPTLAFTVNPTNTVEGAAVSPAIQVTSSDSGFAGDVTLAIEDNPSAGTLSGTLTVTASGGVAVFNNVKIDKAGVNYTLLATAPGHNSAESAQFSVTPVVVAEYHTTPPIVDPYPVVVINGSAYRAQEGTLRIEHRVGAESRASFTILDTLGTIDLEDHMEVFVATLNIDNTWPVPLFGGFIQNVEATNWLPSGSRRLRVDCHGYRYLAHKRVIDRVYENTLMTTIFSDLMANEFAEELVTQRNVAGTAGITVKRLEFNYTTIADVLDELGRLVTTAPLHWAIWPRAESLTSWEIRRELDFYEIGEINVTPTWEIAISDMLLETLRVEHFTPDYRNKEYLTEAQDEIAALEETFMGDGFSRSFSVGHPISSEPTIAEDRGTGFVNKTVGIKNVSTGKDWYWNQGSGVVTQDPAGVVLGEAHKVRVSYTGLAPMVAVASDALEISRIATLEGTSGKVERVDNEFQAIGRLATADQAAGRLRRWARRGVRFSVDTRSVYYEPSTHLAATSVMTIPELGLVNETMVIEALEIVDDPVNKVNGVRYRPTFVTESAIRPAWEETFRQKPLRLSRHANIVEVPV